MVDDCRELDVRRVFEVFREHRSRLGRDGVAVHAPDRRRSRSKARCRIPGSWIVRPAAGTHLGLGPEAIVVERVGEPDVGKLASEEAGASTDLSGTEAVTLPVEAPTRR